MQDSNLQKVARNYNLQKIAQLKQEIEKLQAQYRLLCESILNAEDEYQMVALAQDGLRNMQGQSQLIDK